MLEPLWVHYSALLPMQREINPTNPLGGHRHHIPDRAACEHVVPPSFSAPVTSVVSARRLVVTPPSRRSRLTPDGSNRRSGEPRRVRLSCSQRRAVIPASHSHCGGCSGHGQAVGEGVGAARSGTARLWP